MKPIIAAFALLVLAPVLLSSSNSGSRQQSAEVPQFHFDIHAATDRGPTFTVTNLSNKTLTACVISFSVSSGTAHKEGKMVWDTAMETAASAYRRPIREPLQLNASMTMPLPHRVDGPIPDKIEITAGIWADGQTFGDASWVKRILDSRAMEVAGYRRAIAILRQGLAQNWTRDQYLAAIGDVRGPVALYGMKRTLEANPHASAPSMQSLLDSYIKILDRLLQAKPAPAVPTTH